MGESALQTASHTARKYSTKHMIKERYCTNCQAMRPIDTGKIIKTGKINRWRCNECTKRTNKPRYIKQSTK